MKLFNFVTQKEFRKRMAILYVKIWSLKHPPKFKIGDKVKRCHFNRCYRDIEYLVIDSYIREGSEFIHERMYLLHTDGRKPVHEYEYLLELYEAED